MDNYYTYCYTNTVYLRSIIYVPNNKAMKYTDYSYGNDIGKVYVSERIITEDGIKETKRFVSEADYNTLLDKLNDIKSPNNWADGKVPKLCREVMKNMYDKYSPTDYECDATESDLY